MQTNRVLGLSVVALAVAAAFVAGCNGNPPPGSAAYKEGELGNGDFLFACDDGVACLPYSGDAKKFPRAIASGATFDVRFVSKNEQGATVNVDFVDVDGKRYEGLRTTALPPFVEEGPDGSFVAAKPGFGTVVVRDQHSFVVDYVTLNIVKPDALVVYDANYDVAFGTSPPQLQTVTLKVDERSSYRVFAEHARDPIAGSIPVTWTSADPEVLAVESYSPRSRVVTVVAKKAGTTTLQAEGAGLTKPITVEVK